MTIERFQLHLSQHSGDRLWKALEGFRRMEPRRALELLADAEPDSGGWWEWKPASLAS